jgi:hypothetical protein
MRLCSRKRTRSPDERSDIRGWCRKIPDVAELIRPPLASDKLLLPEPGRETIAPSGEHHMTNILTFFSTRTLLQIVFVLGSAVAMKAWSLGLLFGG